MFYIKSVRLFQIVPILLFALVSLLIVCVWFRSGLYYGGAEVGLSPYFNPQRFLDIQKYIWWGDVAPGMLIPQFINAVPFYFVLSILQSVLSPLILQAFLFFILLFLMGTGMYIYTLEIIGREKYRYGFIAGIFYMFNSYMMVEVWHRFLYTGIFLAAAIPILALFWQRWIREGRIIPLIIFLLTNLAFSYMYGNLTSVIAIWILFLFITSAHVIFPWQGKRHLLKVGYRFILGLMLFLGTNLWWLIPVFTVSTGVLPEQHSSEDNIFTIVNISKQTILPFTLQFANPYYLFLTQELGAIYSSFLFLLLPWIPAVIIFIGLLTSFKNKLLTGFGVFFLFSVILAKGAASPFGYPYIWGFMNIYFLAVIRNPFEKLGVLLPFFGSILFVVGLDTVISWIIKKTNLFFSKFVFVSILISVLVYAFPMFTGRVFNNPNHSFLVKVPQSYKDADNWFKLQKAAQGNILHLPFPSRDVVTYDWENGYHGIEINEILFTSLPSITRNVGIKRIDETLRSLSFIFNKPYSVDSEQILRILQSLNVQYIVLHKDTRWEDSATYGKDVRLSNPNEIEDTLNNLSFLEKSVTFGDLIIYKLKDNFYKPKIVLSDNNSDLVYPGESNIMQILTFSVGNDQVTSIDKNLDEAVLHNFSQLLIFPENVLYSWEPSREVLENILSQPMLDQKNANLLLSQQTSIKQYFHQTGELLSETLISRMIDSSNSLIALTQAKIAGDKNSIQSILENYNNQIDTIFNKSFSGSSLQRQFNPIIAKVFTLHLYILENFSESIKIQSKLNNYLTSNNLLSYYPLDKKGIKGEVERRVHRFNIPINSHYELLMTDIDTLSLYPDVLSKLNFLLDGKSIFLKRSELNGFMSLGEIELNKGVHEISYNVLPSINLAESVDKYIQEGSVKISGDKIVRFEANQQIGAAIKIPLLEVKGGDTYQISFEGLFENPKEFYLQIVEDTHSQANPHDCSKVSCYPLNSSSRLSQWENYSLTLSPLSLASRNANFQLILPTANVSSPYSSSLEIKNLKINRIMDTNLVLRKKVSGQLVGTPSASLIEFKKISNVEYEGKIKLEKPSFMFFKETFNPGWHLQISNGIKTEKINKHYLGNFYGNSYYIDNVGEYNFTLEFEPQRSVKTGLVISIASWGGLVVIFLYTKFRKKI